MDQTGVLFFGTPGIASTQRITRLVTYLELYCRGQKGIPKEKLASILFENQAHLLLLIKYCINSFLQVDHSFDKNRTTSCYSVPVSQLANYISLQQVLTNHKPTIRKLSNFEGKLVNFLSNEFVNLENGLIQYFINTFIATTVRQEPDINHCTHCIVVDVSNYVNYRFPHCIKLTNSKLKYTLK